MAVVSPGVQPPLQWGNAGLGLQGAELWSQASSVEARRHMFSLPIGTCFLKKRKGSRKRSILLR